MHRLCNVQIVCKFICYYCFQGCSSINFIDASLLTGSSPVQIPLRNVGGKHRHISIPSSAKPSTLIYYSKAGQWPACVVKLSNQVCMCWKNNDKGIKNYFLKFKRSLHRWLFTAVVLCCALRNGPQIIRQHMQITRAGFLYCLVLWFENVLTVLWVFPKHTESVGITL